MIQDISDPIRRMYENEKKEPFDEWKEHVKQGKVPTWDYVCWLERKVWECIPLAKLT